MLQAARGPEQGLLRYRMAISRFWQSNEGLEIARSLHSIRLNEVWAHFEWLDVIFEITPTKKKSENT